MKKLNFLFTIACICTMLISCDKLPMMPGGGAGNGTNNGGENGGKDSTIISCVDEARVDSTINCPKDLRPVCGCNNVTYKNACAAKRNGVRKWREGVCRENNGGNPDDSTNVKRCIDRTLIKPNVNCPDYKRPVCGCDDKTYVNPCDAKRHGVIKWKEGKCGGDTNPGDKCIDKSIVDPNRNCPREAKPVCGCNGKTYLNPCDAKRHGVIKWKEGKCGGNTNPGENCIDRSIIDPNRNCPRDAKPVCGCNGKTYLNPCDAKRNGVTKWKEGKCSNNLPSNGK